MPTTHVFNGRMSEIVVRKAIEVAGGQTALAKAIGVTQGHVSSWLRRGNVPADKVIKIEAVTNIPRYELRPDVFPREAS